MTQKQFTKEVVESLEGFTVAEVEAVFDTAAEVLARHLKLKAADNSVAIPVRGLGRFTLKRTKKRAKRKGRNPATGEEIMIAAKPAGKKMLVRPDKALRDAIGA